MYLESRKYLRKWGRVLRMASYVKSIFFYQEYLFCILLEVAFRDSMHWRS